jgi:hypothetical protein
VRKLIGERMTLLREAQKPGNVQAAATKPGKSLKKRDYALVKYLTLYVRL